jgi:alpha-L-fucosidase 2
MKHKNIHGLCAVLLSAVFAVGLFPAAAVLPPDEPMNLWFDKPGVSFLESCVLGNGRLGAMELGGMARDRVILNESSLWSGGPYDGNNYGAHKCLPQVRKELFDGNLSGAWGLLKREFRYAQGVSGWWGKDQFGCYQTLGKLTIAQNGEPLDDPFSPSRHHGAGERTMIANTIDGNSGTKWFVINASQPVSWQQAWPEPKTIDSYSLTSADDAPERDPRSWMLEGSTDGIEWQELDRRTLDNPFEQRHQTKTFKLSKPGTFSFYRITFEPPPGKKFQLSEITLGGTPKTDSHTAAAYRRDLNLMTGVATTRYTENGVTFTREIVVSKPDEVIAVRISADKPGSLTLAASLSRTQNVSYRADGHVQVMEGQLPFNKPGGGGEGMRYQALLGATIKGGKMVVSASGLAIEGADEVVLIVSAGTSYVDPKFEALVRKRMDAALSKSFDAIYKAGSDSHRSLMERVRIDLPKGRNSNLPTPDRVRIQESEPDPSLDALYFQFGRHLMVSGSRSDSQLPTNLQGIWADGYKTAWAGDFHSNINLQMNYWPAEPANLSECHLPLMRFIRNVSEEGRKTAKAYFDAPGWMANHTQNPWFETAPSNIGACIGPTCGAWLTQHIWWHYAFNLDKDFLREFYPVLRSASEFMLAVLIEDPKTKKLVVVPSNSPENQYYYTDKDGKKRRSALCYGSTFDQQITRELLENTAAAARSLELDDDFVKRLDAARAQLLPTRLNDAGRIMEWHEDFEEWDIHHRHVSHLWGLHPGSQINPSTPDLLKGARLTLERRGDASTGWSMAWKANFWARLHDGDRAAKLLHMLIQRGAPNFFCLHPPFQIDGNFGGCAAVAEMLLQSQETTRDGEPVIELLPALPSSWSTGNVTGLRARGGFEVDISWEDGKLEKANLKAVKGTRCTLRYGQIMIPVALKPGESREIVLKDFSTQ